MKPLNLTLHCGGHEVNRAALMGVQTPEATDTWFPIPHTALVDRLHGLIHDSGMSIVDEKHALARDGQRYFGLFQVEGVKNFALANTIGTVICLRNSHDKSFPAAVGAGSAPFVCDNLSFHNEVKIARRHTRFIMRDLPLILASAFGQLMDTWGNNALRIERYQAVNIDNVQAHDLIANAFRNGGISKTQLADVITQWHTPEHDVWATERNLWGLHNAFTNVMRGNLIALPKRSQALHGMFDALAGMKVADAVEIGEGGEVLASVGGDDLN